MSESSLKAALLGGTSQTAEVWLPQYDQTVTVRPLSEGELAEVEVAAVRGQTATSRADKRTEANVTLALDKSAGGQFEARRIKVAYGLSVGNEKWTPREVAKLHPAAVKLIAAKVDELNGGESLVAEAQTFRGDPSWAEFGVSAPDRDSAGA